MYVRFYSQTQYQKHLGKSKSVKYTKIQVKGMFVRGDLGPDFPQGDVCLHLAILFYQVRFKE